MIQAIITIAIFLVVIVLLVLKTKDSYNIADEYWNECWEEENDD